MMIEFENYEDYKQYVKDEWQIGSINELFEDGLIVEVEESFEYDCESRKINYRRLSESEFNSIKQTK